MITLLFVRFNQPHRPDIYVGFVIRKLMVQIDRRLQISITYEPPAGLNSFRLYTFCILGLCSRIFSITETALALCPGARWAYRRIKEKVCLMVYCSPGEISRALDEAIAIYNRTPHEALDNVSPNDVYSGRKEVIPQRRLEKKRLTLERKKQYNLNTKNDHPNQHQGANSS